jgi:hypothetical protein
MNAIVPHQFSAPVFTMGDIERVALAIAKGGLFGSNDPNAVLTLCLLAQAEGQHPAVVFRDYHIIQGKPAKKADAMLRDFVQAGGKVEWHQLTNDVADATFSHPGGGTVRIDWTMQRAQQAGLATPMWKKYPRQMLRSRVISEGVRTVYPGATSGLYEVGEVQDIVADQPARTAPPEPIADVVEHQPQEGGGRKPPLQGPIKTRAALRIACGAFVSELHACADVDMLDEFLATPDAKALVDQVSAESEFMWKGDGGDFLGLEKEIERRRALLEMDANDPNAGYPNAMEAG